MWNEASAKPCTRILFLQLLLGVLLLGGVFLLAVNEDIAATQRTMVNTVNYVKEQCNRYSRIGLADESKSLMRIVESANQTAHRLEETTRPIKSGYQDSNLGPPAPKAGALTGLRYTPSCNSEYLSLIAVQRYAFILNYKTFR